MDITSFLIGKKVGGGGSPSYTDLDIGKVLQKNNDTYSLVSQTAHAKVTENGTIDTTLNNSVEIDVPTGGGGGSDIASGTITFDAMQSNQDSLQITHNLGKTPSGVAWMLLSAPSDYIVDEHLISQGWNAVSAEVITTTDYIGIIGTDTTGQLFYTGVRAGYGPFIWNSLSASSTTIKLFAGSGFRYTGRIWAGSTIRWFVW